ncbi:MAG: hypothetical protein JOZ62_22600, partial [Acidobacteriaceae bacterium]|nr:hypothetical protein [Acidobacteriaceae bacterium]
PAHKDAIAPHIGFASFQGFRFGIQRAGVSSEAPDSIANHGDLMQIVVVGEKIRNLGQCLRGAILRGFWIAFAVIERAQQAV